MSNPAESPTRYHRAAIALHWLIALALVMQLALGFRLEGIPRGVQQFDAFQWHKSLGIAVLLLSLLRLALRIKLPRPAPVGEGLARIAARGTHDLFYLVMIGAPLTGWALVSTAKIKLPTLLFGVLPWPHLPLGAWANQPAEVVHGALGWLLPALIVLHVGGALWHHLQNDAVLARMVPDGRNLNAALTVAALLLGGAAWLGWAGPVPNLWRSAAQAEPASLPSLPAASESADLAEAASPASDSAEPSEAASKSATASQAALSPDWAVQPGGRLGWATQWSGTPVIGSFKRWTAQIRFDPDDLATSRIAVEVDLASSGSGDASRDESIQGPQFFNTAMHPKARFTSSRISKSGKGYAADGTLSLNGVTRPARLNFTVRIDGDRAVASGSAALSRLAFNVGTDEWKATDDVPDAVSVSFTVQARRKAD